MSLHTTRVLFGLMLCDDLVCFLMQVESSVRDLYAFMSNANDALDVNLEDETKLTSQGGSGTSAPPSIRATPRLLPSDPSNAEASVWQPRSSNYLKSFTNS